MMHNTSRTISLIGSRSSTSGERKGYGFESMAFPDRHWADDDYGQRYHVYRTPHDRVTVQAESAVAAIKQTGIKRPYKVERGQVASEQRVGLIRKGRLVAPPAPDKD